MQPIEPAIDDYAFIRSLAGLPFVERIIVYGSRARRENRERSDIDLAISCPSASPSDWSQVMEIVEQADTLLKIDCVRLEDLPTSDQLRQSILRDGKVLFERKPS